MNGLSRALSTLFFAFMFGVPSSQAYVVVGDTSAFIDYWGYIGGAYGDHERMQYTWGTPSAPPASQLYFDGSPTITAPMTFMLQSQPGDDLSQRYNVELIYSGGASLNCTEEVSVIGAPETDPGVCNGAATVVATHGSIMLDEALGVDTGSYSYTNVLSLELDTPYTFSVSTHAELWYDDWDHVEINGSTKLNLGTITPIVAAVPEPVGMALLSLGLLVFGARSKRLI